MKVDIWKKISEQNVTNLSYFDFKMELRGRRQPRRQPQFSYASDMRELAFVPGASSLIPTFICLPDPPATLYP